MLPLSLRFSSSTSRFTADPSIPDPGPLYPAPVDIGSLDPAVPHGAL
jgi:hypothetical protein